MTQASGNSAKAAPVPRPPPVAAYSLSERQEEQLRIYLDYMLEVNKSMNLTGVHLCAVEKLVGGLRSFPAAGQKGVLPPLNTKHGTWIVPLLLNFHPAGVSRLPFSYPGPSLVSVFASSCASEESMAVPPCHNMTAWGPSLQFLASCCLLSSY